MTNYLYINKDEYSDDIRYIRQLILVDVETSKINLSQLDNLERLKLVNASNVPIQISNVSSLTVIHLENIKVDNSQLLYDNHDLSDIYLEFSNLELRYISSPNLQKVSLTGMDEGLVEIHEFDGKYTKIIEKMIERNQSITNLTVTHSNIVNIFEGNIVPINIEILDLSNNFLQGIPHGLYNIVNYGKNFKLKHLHLGYNKVHYIPEELKI